MSSRSVCGRSRTRTRTPSSVKTTPVPTRIQEPEKSTTVSTKRCMMKSNEKVSTSKDSTEHSVLATRNQVVVKSSTRSSSSPKPSTSPRSTSPRTQQRVSRPEGTRLGIFEKLEKIRQDSPKRDADPEVNTVAVDAAGIHDKKLLIMKQALETSLMGSDVDSDSDMSWKEWKPSLREVEDKSTCDVSDETDMSRNQETEPQTSHQQSYSPQPSDDGEEFPKQRSVKKLRKGPACASDSGETIIRGVTKVKEYIARRGKSSASKAVDDLDCESDPNNIEVDHETHESSLEHTEHNLDEEHSRIELPADLIIDDGSRTDNVANGTSGNEMSNKGESGNEVPESICTKSDITKDVNMIEDLNTIVIEPLKNSEPDDVDKEVTSTQCALEVNSVSDAARNVQVYTSVSSVLQSLPKGDQKQPVICLPKVDLQPKESRMLKTSQQPLHTEQESDLTEGQMEAYNGTVMENHIDCPKESKESTERSAFSTAKAICEAHLENPSNILQGSYKRVVRSKSLEDDGCSKKSSESLSLVDKMDSLIHICLRGEAGSSADGNSDSPRTSPRARKKTSLIEDYLASRKSRPTPASLKIGERSVEDGVCKNKARRTYACSLNTIAGKENIEEKVENTGSDGLVNKFTNGTSQSASNIKDVISAELVEKDLSCKEDESTLFTVSGNNVSDDLTVLKNNLSSNAVRTIDNAESKLDRPITRRELKRARGKTAPELISLVEDNNADTVLGGTASEVDHEIMNAVKDKSVDAMCKCTSNVSTVEKNGLSCNQQHALPETLNSLQHHESSNAVHTSTVNIKPKKSRPKSVQDLKPTTVGTKTASNGKNAKQELEEKSLQEDVAESVIIQSPVRSRSGRAIKLTSAAIEAGLAHESSMSFLVGSTGSKERLKPVKWLDFPPEQACLSRESSPEKAHGFSEYKGKKRGRKCAVAVSASSPVNIPLYKGSGALETPMVNASPGTTSILKDGVSQIPTASSNIDITKGAFRKRSPPKKKTIREILNITEEDLNVDMPPLTKTGIPGRHYQEENCHLHVKEVDRSENTLILNSGNFTDQTSERGYITMFEIPTEKASTVDGLCKNEEKAIVLPDNETVEKLILNGDGNSKMPMPKAKAKPVPVVSAREKEIDDMLKRGGFDSDCEENRRQKSEENEDLPGVDAKKNHTLFSLISQVTGSMNAEQSNLPPIERPPSDDNDDEELPLIMHVHQDSSEEEDDPKKCSNDEDDDPEEESGDSLYEEEEEEEDSDSDEEESSSSDFEKETADSECVENSTQLTEDNLESSIKEDGENSEVSHKVDKEIASCVSRDTENNVILSDNIKEGVEVGSEVRSSVVINSNNQSKEDGKNGHVEDPEEVKSFKMTESENKVDVNTEDGVGNGQKKVEDMDVAINTSKDPNDCDMGEEVEQPGNLVTSVNGNQNVLGDEHVAEMNVELASTKKTIEHSGQEVHHEEANSSSNPDTCSEKVAAEQVPADNPVSSDDPFLDTPEDRLMFLEQQLKQLDTFISSNKILIKPKLFNREEKKEVNEYKADLSGLKMEEDCALNPEVKIKTESTELVTTSGGIKESMPAVSGSFISDKQSTSEENLHRLFEKPGPANKKKASAFFSNELDDYLTKNCKLSQKYEPFKQPLPKPTVPDNTKTTGPDVDMVDDLVFYAFSSQDALEEYVKNGDCPLSPTSITPNITLKMPKLEPSIGAAAFSATDDHKTPEKTDDVTKIKGWKSKFNHEENDSHRLEPPRLSPGGPMGVRVSPTPEGAINSILKIHWRTKERLLRNLAPDEISTLGLSLKRRRRKSKQLTHRKGAKVRHPSNEAGGDSFEGRMRPPIMRPKKLLRPMVLTPSMVMSAMSALKVNKAKAHRHLADTCPEPTCRWGCICYMSDVYDGAYIDGDNALLSSSYGKKIPALPPCGKEYCRLGCLCYLINQATTAGKPLALTSKQLNARRRSSRKNKDPDWDYNESESTKKLVKHGKMRKLTLDGDGLPGEAKPLNGGSELEASNKAVVAHTGAEPTSRAPSSEMSEVKSSSVSGEHSEVVTPEVVTPEAVTLEPGRADPAQGSYLSIFGLTKKSDIAAATVDGKEVATVRKSSRLKDRTGIGHIDKLKDLMYFDLTKWEDGQFTGTKKKIRKEKRVLKEGRVFHSRGYIPPVAKDVLPPGTVDSSCKVGVEKQSARPKAAEAEGHGSHPADMSLAELLKLQAAHLAATHLARSDMRGRLPGQHDEQPIAISDDDDNDNGDDNDNCSGEETFVSARTTLNTALRRQRCSPPSNLTEGVKSQDAPVEKPMGKSSEKMADVGNRQQRPSQEEKKSGEEESSSSSSTTSRTPSIKIRKQMVLLARNHAARRNEKIEFKPELDDRQPHLLEIQSDCNWQPIRSHLLNQISIIADRDDLPPSGHKLCRRIGAFIVEIRPPADQHTPLPLNLQTENCRSLPAIRIMITQEAKKISIATQQAKKTATANQESKKATQEARKSAMTMHEGRKGGISVRDATGEKAQTVSAHGVSRPLPPPYSHPHTITKNTTSLNTSCSGRKQSQAINQNVVSNDVLPSTGTVTSLAPPFNEVTMGAPMGMSALSRMNISLFPQTGTVQSGSANRMAPSNFTHYENLAGHLPGRLHTADSPSSDMSDTPIDDDAKSTVEKPPRKPTHLPKITDERSVDEKFDKVFLVGADGIAKRISSWTAAALNPEMVPTTRAEAKFRQNRTMSESGLDIQSLSDALRLPSMSLKRKRVDSDSSQLTVERPSAGGREEKPDTPNASGIDILGAIIVNALHSDEAKGGEAGSVETEKAKERLNAKTGEVKPIQTDIESSTLKVADVPKYEELDSDNDQQQKVSGDDDKSGMRSPLHQSTSEAVTCMPSTPPLVSRLVCGGPRLRFPAPNQSYGQSPQVRRGPGPRMRLPVVSNSAGTRMPGFIPRRPRIRIPLSAISMSPITVNLTTSSDTMTTCTVSTGTMMVAPMAVRIPMPAEHAITKVAGSNEPMDTLASGSTAPHPDCPVLESASTDPQWEDTAEILQSALLPTRTSTSKNTPLNAEVTKKEHSATEDKMVISNLNVNGGEMADIADNGAGDQSHDGMSRRQVTTPRGTVMLGPLSDTEETLAVTKMTKPQASGDNVPVAKHPAREATDCTSSARCPAASGDDKDIQVVIVSDDSEQEDSDVDVTSPEKDELPAARVLRHDRNSRREDGLQRWLQQMRGYRRQDALKAIESQAEQEALTIWRRERRLEAIRRHLADKKIKRIIAEKKEHMAADKRERRVQEKRQRIFMERACTDDQESNLRESVSQDSPTRENNGRTHMAKAEHIARERLRRSEIARKFSRLRAAVKSVNFEANPILDSNTPIKESSKQAVLVGAKNCIVHQKKEERRLERQRGDLLQQRVSLINRLKALKYPPRLDQLTPNLSATVTVSAPTLPAPAPAPAPAPQPPAVKQQVVKRIKGQWGPASKRRRIVDQPQKQPEPEPEPEPESQPEPRPESPGSPTLTITAVRSLAEGPPGGINTPVYVSSSDEEEADQTGPLLSGGDDDSNDYLSSRSHSTTNDD